MKISGHKNTRIFDRYNIVDTRDVGEAMRKLVEYEEEKRLARAKRVVGVHTSLTNPKIEAEKPALPAKVQ